MTAPNPASADPTPITRADMLRLADELDHTCCVAGDMETSKPLRGLIAAIRATFPAPSPRPTCSRGHPIGGKMTLEQAGGKKMCECVVPAPSPAGGGWRERCVVRREDFGKSFAYAVYSSGGGFALSDGDWYGVGFPPETNARFPTESAARAALAKAGPPPGVTPCKPSAESGASSSDTAHQEKNGSPVASPLSLPAGAGPSHANAAAASADSPGAGGDDVRGMSRVPGASSVTNQPKRHKWPPPKSIPIERELARLLVRIDLEMWKIPRRDSLARCLIKAAMDRDNGIHDIMDAAYREAEDHQ